MILGFKVIMTFCCQDFWGKNWPLGGGGGGISQYETLQPVVITGYPKIT